MEYFNEIGKATPVTDVDPRERMKQVRSTVKDFVEGKSSYQVDHIGQLYTDPADMARAMIALHDMLDDRIQRHNKASNHVADLLADNDRIIQTNFEQDGYIAVLETLNTLHEQTCKVLEDINRKLKEDLAIQDRKLEAALITLQTVMEG